MVPPDGDDDPPVSGQVDMSFIPQINGPVYAVEVLSGQRILVTGNFTQVNGEPRPYLCVLNLDGSLSNDDLRSVPTLNGFVFAVRKQPDDRIVIGGAFTSVGGNPRSRVARLNADGSFNDTLNADANEVVLGIDVQTEENSDRIVIGGNFTTVNEQSRSYLARLSSTGILDAGFDPVLDGGVGGLAVFGSTYLIGGAFTTVDGVPRAGLARLNGNGELDTSLPDLAVNGVVQDIAIQGDGSIVFVGGFSNVGATPRQRIAKVSSSGLLAEGFAPGANDTVRAVVVQPDGKLLVGGDFTEVGGSARSYLARLAP
jgi:uncharacterized delta-60 repeat protein